MQSIAHKFLNLSRYNLFPLGKHSYRFIKVSEVVVCNHCGHIILKRDYCIQGIKKMMLSLFVPKGYISKLPFVCGPQNADFFFL
jgi:hypothetical protein